MGMSNRAVANNLLRLQEFCEPPPPNEPNRDTSEHPAAESEGQLTENERSLPSVSQKTSVDSVADHPDQVKKDEQRRSRSRLTELEQQLQMAESRCGTLKHQIDYMRVLYQGVDRTRTPPKLPTFDVATEPPVKEKKDRSPNHHRHKRPSTSIAEASVDGVSNLPSTSPRPNPSPHSQHETVSTPTIPDNKVTRELLVSLPPMETNEPPVRDLIDFGENHDDDGGNEHKKKHHHQERKEAGGRVSQAAVEAMQSILCGMRQTVDEVRGQQPKKSEKSRKHHRHHVQKNPSQTLVDVDKEVTSLVDIRRPHHDTMSETAVEDVYNRGFQRVYASEHLTRKVTKTRHAPRKDQPYGLLTASPDIESDDSVQGKVKRKKTTSKKVEKKSKATGSQLYANTSVRLNDDASVITTRTKKKKLIKPRRSTSQNTLKSHRKGTEAADKVPVYTSDHASYDNWLNNSLVELYHNTNIKTETSLSEEHIKGAAFMENDSPSMISYLKKTREEANIASRLGKAKPDMTLATVRVVEKDWDRRSSGSGSGSVRCEPVTSGVDRLHSVHRDSSKVSHFELPTVSSRMKQVDRSYYQQFNFKNIPFVVGKSTTRSHNLGLNIQQVLSIIKNRQPIAGLSPMALAGGLLRESQLPGSLERPITSLLSRMSHRTMASRRSGAFPPTIPEHDEMELPQRDHEGCQEFKVHPGSFRNLRSATKKMDLDLGLRREATNLNDNFETYRADWGKKTTDRASFPNKKYSHVLSRYMGDGSGSPRKGDRQFNKTLHSQMSGMKVVMQRLHDDFDRLSRDYEELCMTVERDDTGRLIHDEDHNTLKEMASAVQNKENEIKLVMELLGEVSSLHKMVASLNQKTSLASMTGRVEHPVHTLAPRQKNIIPRDLTASVRLTRLLRTIQSFQEKLKHEK